MDAGGRLGASDIGGIEGVVRVGLTFAGEGMEGNRLVSDVVHRKREGVGEETVEQRGGKGIYREVKHMAPARQTGIFK